MRELALFAGAGGGILGGILLGWRTVCAVELDAYCRSVLLARQRDGILPAFPIWDDVRTFDGRPWRGHVDVISGGFPCQDISAAGKGAGIDGARSGLWSEFARIIGEVQPRFAFVENSPMLLVRGLGRVLGDLASLGYDTRWGVVSAADVGAPHLRERIWIVADARHGLYSERTWTPWRQAEQWTAERSVLGCCGKDMAHADSIRRESMYEECGCPGKSDGGAINSGTEWRSTMQSTGTRWWATEPDVGRVAHGVAARVDRLRAIGNGQVPLVAAVAWEKLTRYGTW